MAQTLQVVAIETKSGVSKKSGQPYQMEIAKCVLTKVDGSVDVGEVMLPKGHAPVTPGLYSAETALSKSMNGQIVGVIVSLTPAKPVAAPRAA